MQIADANESTNQTYEDLEQRVYEKFAKDIGKFCEDNAKFFSEGNVDARPIDKISEITKKVKQWLDRKKREEKVFDRRKSSPTTSFLLMGGKNLLLLLQQK